MLRSQHDQLLVATATPVKPNDNLDCEVHDTSDSGEVVSLGMASHWSIAAIVLTVSGILPLPLRNGCSTWLRTVHCLPLLCVLFFIYGVAQIFSGTGYQYDCLCIACITLSAVSGVLSLRAQHIQDLLGPCAMPLAGYAAFFFFSESWRILSLRRFFACCVMWATAVLSRVGSFCFCTTDEHSWRIGLLAKDEVLVFSLTAGMTMMFSLGFCVLHVCSCLEMAIDQYCFRFFQSGDLNCAIDEWNVLQALLRKSARCVDACLLSIGTGVLAMLVLTGTELLNMSSTTTNPLENGLAQEGQCLVLWSGSVIPPTALFFYVVICGARITEKCNRVPALVNSWAFTEFQIDTAKHYVVQYIMQSAAGFYVQGVRLTMTSVLKLSYLLGIVVFSIISHVIRNGDS